MARQSVPLVFIAKTGRLCARAQRRLTRSAGELGQSMVELALVLPVFLFLFAGVVEVGNALNSYLTVVDVSRDAARLGSKGLATDADIRNMASVEMAKLPDAFNSTTDLTITHNPVPGTDTSIKVRVCSNHHLMLPLLSTFVGNPLQMCASTTMRTITFQD
ncbi:MAG: TadE family protein [Dehalococcoidia bacterium]